MNSKARITYRFDSSGQLIPVTKNPLPTVSSSLPANNTTTENRSTGNTITDNITINNKSTAVISKESEPASESITGSLIEFTTEFSPWTSPFQDDVHALEQLIRDSSAITKEQLSSSTDEYEQPLEDEQSYFDIYSNGFERDDGEEVYEAPHSLPDYTVLHDTKQYDMKHDTNRTNLVERPVVEHQNFAEQYVPVEHHDFVEQLDYVSKPEYAFQPIIELDEEVKTPKLYYASSRLRNSSSKRTLREPMLRIKGPSWLKVALSVAAAVVTGSLFGYMALALFAGGGAWPSGDAGSGPAAPVQTTSSGQGTNAASGNNSTGGSKGTAASNMIAVDIKPQVYQLLQFGVFKGTESTDAAVAQLQSSGFAASMAHEDGVYRVYAGFAGDRTEALALAGQLQGLEVYVKEFEIPALSSAHFSGDPELLSKFTNSTASLVAAIGDFSRTELQKESLPAAGESGDAAWNTLHQTWTSQLGAVRKGIADEQTIQALDKLGQSMNSAVQFTGNYIKHPSRAYLWSTQEALLDALLAEKDTVRLLGAL